MSSDDTPGDQPPPAARSRARYRWIIQPRDEVDYADVIDSGVLGPFEPADFEDRR